ncbi:hypothetical protein HK096_000444, partial [Nowakowskiella sp. JEL0078]
RMHNLRDKSLNEFPANFAHYDTTNNMSEAVKPKKKVIIKPMIKLFARKMVRM